MCESKHKLATAEVKAVEATVEATVGVDSLVVTAVRQEAAMAEVEKEMVRAAEVMGGVQDSVRGGGLQRGRTRSTIQQSRWRLTGDLQTARPDSNLACAGKHRCRDHNTSPETRGSCGDPRNRK